MITYIQHTIITEEKLICNQPKRELTTIQLVQRVNELKAARWDSSNAGMRVVVPQPTPHPPLAPSNQCKARRTLVYSVYIYYFTTFGVQTTV